MSSHLTRIFSGLWAALQWARSWSAPLRTSMSSSASSLGWSLLHALGAIARQWVKGLSAMLGFNLGPVLWLVGFLAAAGGAWWVVDRIGDAREYKVRAEYAEAARRKNVDISKFNSADDALAAVVEQALAAQVAASALVPGTCPASEPQAKALTKIRRVR